MPTYEFRCRTCGSTFEQKRPMAEASDPAPECPDGHLDTVRLLSVFASTKSPTMTKAPVMAPSGGGGCCGGSCGCH